jgi:hypothetical protein
VMVLCLILLCSTPLPAGHSAGLNAHSGHTPGAGALTLQHHSDGLPQPQLTDPSHYGCIEACMSLAWPGAGNHCQQSNQGGKERWGRSGREGVVWLACVASCGCAAGNHHFSTSVSAMRLFLLAPHSRSNSTALHGTTLHSTTLLIAQHVKCHTSGAGITALRYSDGAAPRDTLPCAQFRLSLLPRCPLRDS